MTMNDRIHKLRTTLHLSQKEFAGRIGLKQNTISYIEQGKSGVTEQSIKNICSQFHVNEKWLRTGEGEMLIEKIKVRQEFFDIFEELPPAFQDYLIRMAQELLDTQSKL